MKDQGLNLIFSLLLSIGMNFIHCILVEEVMVTFNQLGNGSTLQAISLTQYHIMYMFKIIYGYLNKPAGNKTKQEELKKKK